MTEFITKFKPMLYLIGIGALGAVLVAAGLSIRFSDQPGIILLGVAAAVAILISLARNSVRYADYVKQS